MHLLLAIGLTALLMATSFTFLKVADPHFLKASLKRVTVPFLLFWRDRSP
jgi:hypothetical protein